MKPPTPAQAYWNQRHRLAGKREMLLSLLEQVQFPNDLVSQQAAQLLAYTLEFSPDLIIELGRGYGNSTCAFTLAANLLGAGHRVLSLCDCNKWQEQVVPRLSKVVPASWFQPLQALVTDIVPFDFQTALAEARRVLIFWDAHGFAVAETVLGRIMPVIAHRPHAVLMHDMTDGRYCELIAPYGSAGIWKGEADSGARFRLGHIESHVAQVISVQDFATRNQITLDSADHSFHTELSPDVARIAEMRQVLGDQLFSLSGHWFWFSLNEAAGPYTFPQVDPTKKSNEEWQHHSVQLQKQNELLHHELYTYRRRVQELSNSRWRKLGLSIGLAKKASWE